MSKGVLLVNLGSPDSPSVSHVRRYLRQFLMDERVLDTPYLVRFGVVHGAILPFRPKQSAEAYRAVWLPEGSPLVVTSRRVRDELRRRVAMPVELAMRYQNPSVESAVRSLVQQGVNELLLITLFPHYAMSSFETAVEEVKRVMGKLAPGMRCGSCRRFIRSPVTSRRWRPARSRSWPGYDHLLFSFHGLPERHMRKADRQAVIVWPRELLRKGKSGRGHVLSRAMFPDDAGVCEARGRAGGKIFDRLPIRLGRDPWLKPYTDHELERMAAGGIKNLLSSARVCLGLPGDAGGDRHARARIFPEGGRQPVRLDPLPE